MEIGKGDFAEVRIEIKAIQGLIKQAILSRAEGLSELVDQEVEKALTPGRILSAIQKEITIQFEHSLKWGEGSNTIARIVNKKVEEVFLKMENASSTPIKEE